MNKKIIVIAFVFWLLNPLLVYAQPSGTGTATTQTPLPTYSGVDSSIKDYLCTPTGDGSDLERCINRLYRFGITAGALVLVFFVVVAGYFYITGGETGKGKAKGILMNCLTGMGILLGSYALLYFINPNLASFRPIQPPIFSADDLPSCAEVGLGESCVTTDGGISFGGATCEMPIADSAVTGFNNSVHNPWDNNPETPDRHRTVRKPPNSPPPSGAVDLKVARQSPVYSPVSGKVDYRSSATALGGSGSYITISTDLTGSGCSAASGCANLAHIDPSVSVGQTVTAGQQVGVTTVYQGSFGPHLHLELKLGGQWLTGDGKKGTWDNMKAAISRCKSSTVGGGTPGAGGNPPIDTSKAPSGMVEVNSTTHPGIQFDMKYASTDNFTGAKLYTHGKCYLTSSAAAKLKKAQAASSSQGKNLVIYDCYRPKAVQELMVQWAEGKAKWATKQPTKSRSYYVDKYIAEPGSGKHPLGKAVDLSFSGASMPSAFDTFDTSARYTDSNSDAKYLRAIMISPDVKFSPYNDEWWHFSE